MTEKANSSGISEAERLASRLLEAEPGAEPGDEPESPKEFLKRRVARRSADAEDHSSRENDRAEPCRRWPEWEDLEDWQRQAALEMEQETNLVFSLEERDRVSMNLESRRGRSFEVYQDDDMARRIAINRVVDDLRNEPELFNQDWLQGFIDAENIRRQIESDEQNNQLEMFHDQFPSYEEKRDELIEQDELERDDFYGVNDEGDEVELEIDDKLETKIDRAIDDYVEKVVARQLEDPIQYLVDIYGEKEGMEQAMKIGGIDEQEAAEDAVNTDGVAHFLGRYDGNEISLPSGAVAYRTN